MKDSTPHKGIEGAGIGDTTSSIGNNSSALNIDTAVVASSKEGDVSTPHTAHVKFMDDSQNASAAGKKHLKPSTVPEHDHEFEDKARKTLQADV